MNNFFTIVSQTSEKEGTYNYEVKLNSQHKVFEGHFPGNPIVPGVMSMMMIRMLAEETLGRSTRYAAVKDCKYLQTIVPDGNIIKVNVTTDGTALSGEILSSAGEGLMKIKASIA